MGFAPADRGGNLQHDMSGIPYSPDEAKASCADWLEAVEADAMEDLPVLRSACLKLLKPGGGHRADLTPHEQRAIDWMMNTVLGIEFARAARSRMPRLRQRTWLGRLLDQVRGHD